MLPQPPDICLVPSQSGAVDSGLLSSTDTDCLTILDIADRIRLGIFQGNQRNQQVMLLVFRQVLVLCYDVFQHAFINFQVISALFKGYAKYLFPFQCGWFIGRVNLNDVISALPLGFQDLECFRFIARCNDSVRNFPLNHLCSRNVTNIRQCDEVAVRGHSICTSCSCISTSQRRKFAQIIDKINFL